MESTEIKSFLFAPDGDTQENINGLMSSLSLDRTKTIRHVITNYESQRQRANDMQGQVFRLQKELEEARAAIENYLRASQALENYNQNTII